MKICNTCSQSKTFSDYYISQGRYFNRCKQCVLDIHHKRKPLPAPRTRTRKSPAEVQARQTAYVRERRRNNPLVKIRANVGTLIANALSNQGYKKSAKSAEILGCSFEQFYNHIESQFAPGQSWLNRQSWDIDHIVPVSFAQTEDELILLNHYTNLRPMWKSLNQSKASSLTTDSIQHPLYKQITENRIRG